MKRFCRSTEARSEANASSRISARRSISSPVPRLGTWASAPSRTRTAASPRRSSGTVTRRDRNAPKATTAPIDASPTSTAIQAMRASCSNIGRNEVPARMRTANAGLGPCSESSLTPSAPGRAGNAKVAATTRRSPP